MLVVNNQTPFAADRTTTSDMEGALVWIVAVKATFDIAPDGSTALAEEQPPVCLAPEHIGKPGESSLRYDSDLVLTKPTTDVVLLGHAYAPQGKPAFQTDVTMMVANISKTLRVTGDRKWEQGVAGPKMTEVEPFLKMPITYERAYGGGEKPSPDVEKPQFERRNPVGTGYAKRLEGPAGQAVPNVEDPNALQSPTSLRTRPIGFGPIERHWLPRADFAGTYDEKWVDKRLPLLPRDFDDRFYQFAPPDQQTPQYLRGGEPVALVNLTPEGMLRFALPRIWLTFQTRFHDEIIDHHGNLHSVIIEPDAPRVSLVWHTSLPCHGKDTKLEETVVRLKEFQQFSK